MCRELSQDFHGQLVELTARYDAETKTRLGELAARYELALQQHELEIQRHQLEVARALESRAEVVESMERQRELFGYQLEQADSRHQAMIESLSWRITSPLRRALDFVSRAGRKNASAPSPDPLPVRAMGEQPPRSPATRAWLARIDAAAEERQA